MEVMMGLLVSMAEHGGVAGRDAQWEKGGHALVMDRVHAPRVLGSLSPEACWGSSVCSLDLKKK